MPPSIRSACATALAAMLAAGPATEPARAQGLDRELFGERFGRSAGDRTRERRRFRTLDPLPELPRTAEPRSSEPRSSDPSEGERRQDRDRTRDRFGEPTADLFGQRATFRDGEARADATGEARADANAQARDRPAADPSLADRPLPVLLPPAELLEDEPSEDEPRETRDEDQPATRFYEPLGVRIGSFLVFPNVGVEYLYTDNVFESADIKKSDSALALSPNVVFRSDWSRHALSGEANGLFSFFKEFSSEDEKDVDAAMRARLDVTRRTNLEAETTYQIEQESRSSINIPDGAEERPDEETVSAALQVNHRLNRVRLRLRGEVVEETYDDVTLLGGGSFDNSARDNTEYGGTLRVGYEFKPDITAFVEGSFNEIVYERSTDGIIVDEPILRRDSQGYEVQAGLAFELGGQITGDVAGGYARQTPDDSTLRVLEGPILNANLNWRLSGLTTVSLNAQSSIDASITTDSPGSLNQTIELAVEHVMRRHLILGASIFYEIDDFGGTIPDEHEFIGSFSAEYLLTRSLGLTARYSYDKYNGAGDDDYTENEVRVGVRLRR